MQKNTILGFVLIGLILIGFSWYNSYNYKKQAREAFVKDSLARIEALTNPRVADSLRIADSIRNAALGIKDTSSSSALQVSDSSSVAVTEEVPSIADSLLNAAQNAEESLYVLENEKLKLCFTSKGAQIKTAQIKGYKTYGNDSLYIVKENYSDMSLVFNTVQEIRTSSFNFEAVEQTDSSIVFRLPFSSGAHLDFAYSLPKDSYQLDFNIITEGLGGQMSNNASDFDLDWKLRISRFEKGYDNEKNYSTVNFKYPGEKSVEDLGMRKAESQKDIPTKIQWFAFHQQFFSAILMSDDNFSSGNLSYKFLPENDPDSALFDCSANMQMEYGRGEDVNIPMHFYFGPNLYKVLKSYGNNYEKIIPLGGSIIGWINRVVIINTFDFLRKFISNYGIIILIMTILIKLVLSPLTYKSYLSSAKMRVLKPEIDKINKKYPKREDAMKKQQETMALYQKTGVSMMGGCLPMLLQIPILFAMFRFFPVSFELRQHPFLWASDLSGYDSILDLGFNIPMYGNHVSLFALLMAISMYLFSKMNMQQMPDNGSMPGMKGMQLYFMPAFMLGLCNNFSSGLSYYYMLSNFISIGQNWLIRKYGVDEEKLYAQLKSRAESNKGKKKSKWRERMEAMMKEQERLQRERQKKK